MKQEYFIYENIKYNSGTDIVINKYDSGYKYPVRAVFLYYDTGKDVYAIQVGNDIKEYTTKEFKTMIFRCIYNSHPVKYQKLRSELTFQKELEIEGLLLAWIWYIFIMVVAIIFNDRIGIWILSSIIFFRYRNKKIKEAGYK